jgi:hypothetical protein
MARDSWRTRRWRDKLRVWVGRTGWRPADVAARWPRPKPDLAQFEKYDPPVAPVVALYAFGQLVALVALLGWMEWSALSYWAGASLWAFMVWTMVTTALRLEGREAQPLLGWDLLRLACLGMLLVATGGSAGQAPTLAGWTYLALNLCCLPAITLGGGTRERVIPRSPAAG